jgi:hypothetical protein
LIKTYRNYPAVQGELYRTILSVNVQANIFMITYSFEDVIANEDAQVTFPVS